MKLRLQCGFEKAPRKRRTKPVDHFSKCPKCGDLDLIRLDPDVLCSKCDWDSCLWDVQRGGMNNLEAAGREFFRPSIQIVEKVENAESADASLVTEEACKGINSPIEKKGA